MMIIQPIVVIMFGACNTMSFEHMSFGHPFLG